MAERVEWKPVRFRAEMSTADNCVCNACHNVGKVVKLTIPETKYFDGKNLTTRYSEFWLCMSCRESMIQSLTKGGLTMANEKRLIDVNNIYSLFNQNGIARIHVSDIDTIPRVDAVEVVRCRDCKHRYSDSWCEYVDDDDNFYCARGERKDGDGNG